MNTTVLRLPDRPTKPRSTGITMMVDGGLPNTYFADVVQSGSAYLDFVKFGWGTAVVTDGLERKIACLREAGVDYYFGGTLFEKFVLQDRFDDFKDLCRQHRCTHVEVSFFSNDPSTTEK